LPLRTPCSTAARTLKKEEREVAGQNNP